MSPRRRKEKKNKNGIIKEKERYNREDQLRQNWFFEKKIQQNTQISSKSPHEKIHASNIMSEDITPDGN